MTCVHCSGTGLRPIEKGPAGATYTVLGRCNCQTPTVTIPRAKLNALMVVAKTLETEHDFDESETDSCPFCKALAALRAAGIQIERE